MITRQTVFDTRQNFAILTLLIMSFANTDAGASGDGVETNNFIPLIVVEDVSLQKDPKSLVEM